MWSGQGLCGADGVTVQRAISKLPGNNHDNNKIEGGAGVVGSSPPC